MYLISKEKEECCGCRACEDVCPSDAIQCKSDAEGFWYPDIDLSKCINCKKCERVCGHKHFQGNGIIEIYAGWNNKSEERDLSSSGGIFGLIAEYVLKRNGIVVGAAFDENFVVYHTVVTQMQDLRELQRSKYVQSNTKYIYRRVKLGLETDRLVLFSGTPCQIAALVNYLGNKPHNLILCEVFCYGVPSPKVYQKYLENLRKTYRSDIKEINFKDKRYGWDYYTTSIKFKNGKEVCKFQGDSYKTFMQKGYSLRPSCFKCDFNISHSFADISLGDFYNIQRYTNEKINKNGVSCLIVRSKQAQEIIKQLNNITLIKVNCEKFVTNEIRHKTRIDCSVRSNFYHTLDTYGYEECKMFLEKPGIRKKIKTKILTIKKRYFY